MDDSWDLEKDRREERKEGIKNQQSHMGWISKSSNIILQSQKFSEKNFKGRLAAGAEEVAQHGKMKILHESTKKLSGKFSKL